MRTLLLLLAFFSPLTLALGLGQVSLQSALGENLLIEIPLLGVEDISNEEIITTLASTQDYQKLNIERTSLHNELRFALNRTGKNALLKITSQRVINEPYLQFVVQITTPQKTLLREVTVLFDTPKL